MKIIGIIAIIFLLASCGGGHDVSHSDTYPDRNYGYRHPQNFKYDHYYPGGYYPATGRIDRDVDEDDIRYRDDDLYRENNRDVDIDYDNHGNYDHHDYYDNDHHDHRDIDEDL